MTKTYVYHVVTEKPMFVNQLIVFGENQFNGVYDRVMTCKRILDGDNPDNELSRLIRSNIDYWKVRAWRELALEKVRFEKYSSYPSRMACLYASKTLSESEMWANSFESHGRDVYQIVRLSTSEPVFEGDAYNIVDGTGIALEDERHAECYWKNQPNKQGKEKLTEVLVGGTIRVEEIVKEFTY